MGPRWVQGWVLLKAAYLLPTCSQLLALPGTLAILHGQMCYSLSAPSFSSPPSPSSSDNNVTRMRLWSQLN